MRFKGGATKYVMILQKTASYCEPPATGRSLILTDTTGLLARSTMNGRRLLLYSDTGAGQCRC